MVERHTAKSMSGKEERHVPSTPQLAASTVYCPSVPSSETDISGRPRTLHDEVVRSFAPPAGASSTLSSGSANLTATAGPIDPPGASTAAPVMAEQSGRLNTAVHLSNIQITDSNIPPVAQNAAVRQGQSHDDQPPERERTTSRSPISPRSPTAGEGNETDETEYGDEGVGLDGTDEGVDIDLLLQRVADDEARKRTEGP